MKAKTPKVLQYDEHVIEYRTIIVKRTIIGFAHLTYRLFKSRINLEDIYAQLERDNKCDTKS